MERDDSWRNTIPHAATGCHTAKVSIMLVDAENYASGVAYCKALLRSGVMRTCWHKEHEHLARQWLKAHSRAGS